MVEGALFDDHDCVGDVLSKCIVDHWHGSNGRHVLYDGQGGKASGGCVAVVKVELVDIGHAIVSKVFAEVAK